MINQKIAKQILDQVHFEFQSERQYIAMEMYFKKLDLNGYAELFHDYALEERKHAFDMLTFLDDCNCDTTITAEKQEIVNNFSSPAHLFEVALEHEKKVTKAISDIHKNAHKLEDFTSVNFLNKYLEEQVEEEDKMQERLMRLKLAGTNTSAILLLDHEQIRGRCLNE